MITLEQIDGQINDFIVELERIRFEENYPPITPIATKLRLIRATFNTLTRNNYSSLGEDYKSEIESYVNYIVTRVNEGELSEDSEIEAVLNVLKLKYLRYHNCTQNTTN